MSKQSRRKNNAVVNKPSAFVMKNILSLYVFFMLAIYPLYYQDKYFNMGEAKWLFFKYVSLFFGAVVIIGFIWFLIEHGLSYSINTLILDKQRGVVFTDYFVLAYLIICCISALLSPFKEYVMVGYDGWYMGLLSQIGFVLIYFFVSRFWEWDSPAVILYLAIATIVFIFGIVMRFHIDPMEMYTGLEEYYIRNFLSTMGQATWYSSYMCIIFPLGMYAFWLYDKKWQRIVFGVFTSLSFMTLVTQNSDSAFFSLVGILFLLFWKSCESNKGMIRFLEVLIVMLSSFKIMGICQILFADRVVQLDSLSIILSQGNATWMVLIIVLILYFVSYKMSKISGEGGNIKFDISKFKSIRVILLVIGICCTIFVVGYITFNSMGLLPENISSDNNYLRFDDNWGNNRGVSWRAAWTILKTNTFVRLLFGAGPDCFASAAYSVPEIAESLNRVFHEGIVLTCCHNEWLNEFINVGILGGVAYLGIFFSAIFRCIKCSKNYPETFAIALSCIAYFCHNLFCYQQIICTPLIFILIGGAEALIRRGYRVDN